MANERGERGADPGDLLEVGTLVGGKYRIEEVLGRGGMGVVYAAQNERTHKRVALKWMLPRAAADERAVSRFLREARAAGRVDHPNVVDVYDVGQEGDTPFLVMELLRGEPLTVMVGKRPVPADTIIEVLLPAMRGVAAAHELGIVHRDLKPENIFLCHHADGPLVGTKVLDFGISKTTADEHKTLTETGSFIGTPAYSAPEQIRESKDVDERTDVYALGVILYEALTGRLPFRSKSPTALAVEIATETPPSPRELHGEIDPELSAIVTRAMARDPEERFASVEDLALALEPFGRGTTFHTTGARFRARRTPQPVRSPRVGHSQVDTVDARSTGATEDAAPAAGVERAGPSAGPKGPRRAFVGAFSALLVAGLALAIWPRPDRADETASQGPRTSTAPLEDAVLEDPVLENPLLENPALRAPALDDPDVQEPEGRAGEGVAPPGDPSPPAVDTRAVSSDGREGRTAIDRRPAPHRDPAHERGASPRPASPEVSPGERDTGFRTGPLPSVDEFIP